MARDGSSVSLHEEQRAKKQAEAMERSLALYPDVVDEHGTVVERGLCGDCDGISYGEHCPFSFPCPSCKQPPRQRCRRASEHLCDTHVDRFAVAYAQDVLCGIYRRYTDEERRLHER